MLRICEACRRGKFDANDFRIEIAGARYVSEMIRRNVLHNFQGARKVTNFRTYPNVPV
jgi:hypothetical protein